MGLRPMRPLAIVVVQPGRQSPPALVSVFLPTSVGPLARQGDDEALDLAVGARRVWSGPAPAMAC